MSTGLNTRFARIPPHLALLLDFLVTDHVNRMDAQASDIARTFGADHPTTTRARLALADAHELAAAVRVIAGR